MTRLFKILLALVFAFGLSHVSFAQKWLEMMQDPNANFYDTQREFYKYWEPILAKQKQEREEARAKKNLSGGDNKEANNSSEASEEEESKSNLPNYFQFKRWEWFMEPRVYPSGDVSKVLVVWENYLKYLEENNLPFPEGAPRPSK